MREVLDELFGWWNAGKSVGVGTVVATWKSAPRPAGASMLVGPDGTAVGSVSGGCVEGAVYERAQEAITTGSPGLERYGVSDDDAFAVGLTCGGILDIWVERVDRESYPEFGDVVTSVRDGAPVAVVLADAASTRLVPLALPPTGDDRDYVLWRTGGAAPLAVAVVDETGDTRAVGPPPATAGTAPAAGGGFAVSIEPAGAVPARPSDVVAEGRIT